MPFHSEAAPRTRRAGALPSRALHARQLPGRIPSQIPSSQLEFLILDVRFRNRVSWHS